jgi:hypothetical protein
MEVEVAARTAIAPQPKPANTETIWQPGLPAILAMLAAFVAVWTLYLTITEAPEPIKHDMAEAFAWGQEFQLGYNQHPPFWAWICGLWFLLFPRTGWAFALLSSLNAGIGLWGAWMLLSEFASGRKRMAAWMLLLLTPIYTFYAYKYDANTIFLSIWPWALFYFMKSVRARTTGDAIAFGLCVGLAMLSKYYAVLLIASCFLAVLVHPARRKYFASASPYIAAAVAIAVFAPHVWWLLTHHAPPLHYLANITGQRWPEVLDYAQKTLVDGLGMNLGVVALVAWISRRSKPAAFTRDPDSPSLRVLATLTLTPLVLTVVSGLALRTRNTPEMTLGTFALFPLLIIELTRVHDIDRLYRVAARLAVVLTLGALALSPAIAAARTFLSPKAMNTPPYQEAAQAATRLWHERTSLPLDYVGGTDWWENAIAFYSTDRPHVFVHFDYARNLWVTPKALAQHGLLSVCISDDRVCLAETAVFVTPDTTRTEISLAHEFWGRTDNPVRVVITIIPPSVKPS